MPESEGVGVAPDHFSEQKRVVFAGADYELVQIRNFVNFYLNFGAEFLPVFSQYVRGADEVRRVGGGERKNQLPYDLFLFNFFINSALGVFLPAVFFQNLSRLIRIVFRFFFTERSESSRRDRRGNDFSVAPEHVFYDFFLVGRERQGFAHLFSEKKRFFVLIEKDPENPRERQSFQLAVAAQDFFDVIGRNGAGGVYDFSFVSSQKFHFRWIEIKCKFFKIGRAEDIAAKGFQFIRGDDSAGFPGKIVKFERPRSDGLEVEVRERHLFGFYVFPEMFGQNTERGVFQKGRVGAPQGEAHGAPVYFLRPDSFPARAHRAF